MLIVRTPVRVSFFGGGTDLPAYYQEFSGAVLNAAVNKYFYTVLTERQDGAVQVISADLRRMCSVASLDEVEELVEELAVPLAALKDIGCRKGLNLFLASEIPPGTGLGSSASVCVNVLKAVGSYMRVPMSKYELAERAFAVARKRLRRPVGKQDEYAASFGGLNIFEFKSDRVNVLPVGASAEVVNALEERLMLFFTGAAHDSTLILSGQQQATEGKFKTTVEALHQLKELVYEGREALALGNLEQFGELLDRAWQAKKHLARGISDERIDRLYLAARKAGACGGKITGAGGGGFLLLYCERERQPAVREAMVAAGAREMLFQFDYGGATVVYDDPFFDSRGHGGVSWRFVEAGSTLGDLVAASDGRYA